jgi:hypothetical protein
MSLCCNCHCRPVNRPRGLCWSCYYRPGVRNRFPSTSKFARKGVGIIDGPTPLPLVPTTGAPGSLEKIAALAERARLGQSLWHPLDAKYGQRGLKITVVELKAG